MYLAASNLTANGTRSTTLLHSLLFCVSHIWHTGLLQCASVGQKLRHKFPTIKLPIRKGISDIHTSMHHTIIPSYSQQDATFLNLFISKDAPHVSGGSSAHHQEHITVHTASGIVNQYCCSLLPWMRFMVAASSSIGWQYLKLFVQLGAPDDGRRNRLKHVQHL